MTQVDNINLTRLETRLWHKVNGERTLEVQAESTGLGIISATELQEFFSRVLGFDLVRHNEHLEEKNKDLQYLIDDKQRQIKRLDEDLGRIKDKVEKAKAWLIKHDLSTSVFDDIPF